jgi:hypothetical protein
VGFVNRARLLSVLTCLVVPTLCLPALASATTRLATPGGVKSGPCTPTACDLAHAVEVAVDGDQVVVGPGTYKPGDEVEVKSAASVGGEPGAPLPVVQISDHFLHVKNAGATLHDLRVEVVKSTLPYAVTLEAGTVERVYAYSTMSAGACGVFGGTIRDSVCFGGLVVGGTTGGNQHIVLRNVSATNATMGSSGSTATTIDGANLILRSGDPEFAGGADLAVDVSSGSSAAIVLRSSNYATVNPQASSGTDFTYTAPGTAGNQTAPPQFVDFAGGDLHELPGSPTVDTGLTDPLLGATDLEGHPRSQPGCLGGAATPDIGAYELAPTVACPRPATPPLAPPPLVPGSVKLVKVKLDRENGTATLLANVSGPGTLALTGRKVVKRSAGAHGSEIVKLAVVAKGKAKRLLEVKGRAKVKARVAFTPVGGAAVQVTRKLVLYEVRGRRR